MYTFVKDFLDKLVSGKAKCAIICAKKKQTNEKECLKKEKTEYWKSMIEKLLIFTV